MYITVYFQFDYIFRLNCDPNLKTEVFKMKYMCYHTLIGTKVLTVTVMLGSEVTRY